MNLQLSLEPLTLAGAKRAAPWRNACRETLRTTTLSSEASQEEWFNRLPHSNMRYWEIHCDGDMVGLAGLTGIEWENGRAEISLLVRVDERGKGVGRVSVSLVLREAFERMRLNQVYGEVYYSNPHVDFWQHIVEEYHGYTTHHPNSKWWCGRFWSSLYFSIEAGDYLMARYHSADCPCSGGGDRSD